MMTDRRTDMTKLITAFRNFTKASKNKLSSYIVVTAWSRVQNKTLANLIFVRPCIIDTNNIDNKLDATIMIY